MKLSDAYNVSDYRPRANALATIFLVGLAILGVRLWYLQIWKGQDYREFSDKNRFRVERLAAPRGQILDRYGRLLADSRPSFDLTLTRGYTNDFVGELEILREIFEWDLEEYENKKQAIQQAFKYKPILLARDIGFDQLARVESRSLELSGVHVDVIAVRDYLYKEAFFHVLGYMGELNQADLKRLQKKYPERNYRLGDQVGVIGAEGLYERFLRGKDGERFSVVDVRGRKINTEDWTHISKEQTNLPKAGTSIQTSLDLDVQLAAVAAFEGRAGAAVAIEPKTGEILAMVSQPALDPNRFTRGMTGKDFQELRDQPGNPFLDRALAEHYPPGSTLKLVMAAAGLESGVINEHSSYHCPGYFRFGRRTWRCHKAGGHGRVNVHDAIKQSCDVFFYNVALELGLDHMFSWSTRFGLGRPTYFGHEVFDGKHERLHRFNSEVSGMIPNVAWVRRRRNTSVEGETINAGIGQGGFLTTATQLARMTSIFGNGGKVFQPQLVKALLGADGGLIESFEARLENELELEPEVKEAVLDGMRAVVNERGGTGVRSKIKDVDFGGKTGTAQVIRQKERVKDMEDLKEDFRDHSLFVGMAPLADPKIAIAVIVEHGGHGSRAAAPIGKKMVEAYLKKPVIESKSGFKILKQKETDS